MTIRFLSGRLLFATIRYLTKQYPAHAPLIYQQKGVMSGCDHVMSSWVISGFTLTRTMLDMHAAP
jgi:hypothetical protein